MVVLHSFASLRTHPFYLQTAGFQAQRSAAVAHILLAARSWREAASLFARAGELAGHAVERHQVCWGV